MTETPRDRMTELLTRARAGDAAASEELLPVLYQELHDLARSNMAGQGAAHTLQSTALVHEAWLRLGDVETGALESRRQFFALAGKVMRSVLVDHARARGAAKRGGRAARLTLQEDIVLGDEPDIDLLDLDEALTDFFEEDEELARMVELRFFGGLGNPEVAEVLGTSLRSVERGIQVAKLWLLDRLSS